MLCKAKHQRLCVDNMFSVTVTGSISSIMLVQFSQDEPLCWCQKCMQIQKSSVIQEEVILCF